MKKGFSLMELLIVVALLVTIAIVVLVTLNPWAQINKGQDSKRKTELTQLGKVFEDYYNDKQCYPKPQDVCYPSTESGYNPIVNTKCYLCGNIFGSPQISAYLSRLPCDPRQPVKKYLYQVDNLTCPSFYKVYVSLSNTADPATKEYCSDNGTGESDYNWGVSSSNTSILVNCSPVTPAPTSPPGATPTPTIIPTATPIVGNYYCSGYNNCSLYDQNAFYCTPNFFDTLCTGSNDCTSQIGVCIPK